MTPMLELRSVSFRYREMQDQRDLKFDEGVSSPVPIAVQGISLEISNGEWVAVQGPSGSGKSTLLYLMAGFLEPTHGEVHWFGSRLNGLSDLEKACLRNQHIGFVFQQFHLLPRATVFENILLPSVYPIEVNSDREFYRKRAIELAQELGISEHLHKLPNQLSGGQQQRVAIARALLKNPSLIFADEPTGNLDSASSSQVMEILKGIHARGTTIVLITHDREIAALAPRQIRIVDGRIASDESTGSFSHAKPFQAKKLNFHLFLNSLMVLLPLAWQNLWRHRARTFLTMLGVIIGVAAVMAMLTLGRFVKKEILASYETLGANKLKISGHPNWERKAKDQYGGYFLEFDEKRDLKKLPELFPDIDRLSPVMWDWNNNVSFGGRTFEGARSIGTNHEFLNIHDLKLAQGRMITPFNEERADPVCVVGSDIATQLFRNESPLGKVVKVYDRSEKAHTCFVIGVMKAVKSNQEWNQPNVYVILPYSTFRNVNDRWSSRIRDITIQLRSGSDVERNSQSLVKYFEQKYGSAGRFKADSDAVLVAQMRRFLTVFTFLLGSIAALSLVVGGMGITNMMLVSISERLKEIGLRKALGATHLSIQQLLLIETLLICGIAGLLGIVFGFIAYESLLAIAAQFVKQITFQWLIDGWALLISGVAIVAVGVGSGIFPAIRAAKLQVVEALTH